MLYSRCFCIIDKFIDSTRISLPMHSNDIALIIRFKDAIWNIFVRNTSPVEFVPMFIDDMVES